MASGVTTAGRDRTACRAAGLRVDVDEAAERPAQVDQTRVRSTTPRRSDGFAARPPIG
jgi:hypothetical protein